MLNFKTREEYEDWKINKQLNNEWHHPIFLN